MQPDPAPSLNRAIEHTCLKPDATPDDIRRLVSEAIEFDFFGVCVNPLYVRVAAHALAELRKPGREPKLVSVVGFPLGASDPYAIVFEACNAIEHGASEIDMVIPVGLARSPDLRLLRDHVFIVREATRGHTLKVILETGYFSPSELARVAEAVLTAEPDFLKTSTGFGPRGASVEDVELLRGLCPEHVGIKASGGIRTREVAQAMLSAGASRLGTSSGVAMQTEISASASAAAGY